MPNPKDVLTTGEVAKICNVAPRTVSKWFDSGQLHGYRIPGSKDRRIPIAQLVRFMKAHGIPLNGLETGAARLLVVDPDEQFTSVLSETLTSDERFEVRSAPSCFEAGILVAQMQPHAVLVDMNVPGASAKQFARAVRAHPELAETKLIATGAGLTSGQGESFVQEGFAHYLRKPFEVTELIRLINGR